MSEDRIIKKGEIYYADLSPTVGSEQGGIRPVIIIQNNRNNDNNPTVVVIPISSSIKKCIYLHIYT